MKLLVFISLLSVALAQQRTNTNFVANVRRCMKDHPERLNDCIMAQINNIQPQLAGGLPELQLPPLDPFRIPAIFFEHSEPPVVIKSKYDSIIVSGITAFDLKYLDIQHDPVTDHQKLSLGLTIPRLILKGNYKLNGQVFLLNIEGEGPFSSIFEGVIAEGSGTMIPNGNRYVMDKIQIGFKIRSIKTKMENLFNGNKLLGDTVNHFLNENGQLILEEIQPAITGHANTIFKELFNGLFGLLPPDLFQLMKQNSARVNINSRVQSPTRSG